MCAGAVRSHFTVPHTPSSHHCLHQHSVHRIAHQMRKSCPAACNRTVMRYWTMNKNLTHIEESVLMFSDVQCDDDVCHTVC